MAIPFLNHLDLRSVSELQNAILHKTTEGSATNVEGKIIYDTGSDTIKFYNGSNWISLGGDTVRTVKVDTTDNGTANATLETNEALQLIGGTNITLAESGGVVTINAGAATTVGKTNGTQRSGSIELIAGTNVTITEDGTTGHFTFSSTDTNDNTQNVYTLGVPASSTKIRLTGSGHDGASTDDVEIAGSGSVTVTRNNANKLTISGTDTNTDTLQSVADSSSSAENFVTFVANANGAQTAGSDSTFVYIPSSETLKVKNLIVSGDQTISDSTVKVVEDNTLQFEGASGSTNTTELNLTTGVLTGADKTVTLKNESGTVALTSDIKNATITISAGAGLVTGGAFGTNQATNETITIDHEDTSSQASVDNSGLNVIQDVTLDTFGHVTGLGSVDLQSGVDGRITAREFSGTIGNASATVFNIDNANASSPHINHGLGTTSDSFMVQLIEVDTGLTAHADVARKTGGRVQVTFGTAPAANNIRVLITKIG